MTIYVLLSFLGFAFLLPVIGIFCFILVGVLQQKNQGTPSAGAGIEMEQAFLKGGLSKLKSGDSLLASE